MLLRGTTLTWGTTKPGSTPGSLAKALPGIPTQPFSSSSAWDVSRVGEPWQDCPAEGAEQISAHFPSWFFIEAHGGFRRESHFSPLKLLKSL